MIASVHVSDVGPCTALSILGKPPKPGRVDGLRHADAALAAPLSGSVRPAPDLGRIGLVAFWDDAAALDRFLADDPVAARLADGWRVRLDPLRACGSWPGRSGDVATGRATPHDGPAAVLTLGRLRMSQAIRFVRTSARAERAVAHAPGLIWATGFGRAPLLATCSLWAATQALSTYVYGQRDPAHPGAITADATRPFHYRSAFIRFRPCDSPGHLEGRNPLAAGWMATPVRSVDAS